MKVLIAEDEDQTRKYLHDILDKEGFEVVQYHCGSKIMSELDRQSPDFLLLDIELQYTNGPDICKQIRDNGNKTPVIFVTARDSTIDKINGLETGADDYITKPFDIQEVIARIRAVARRCLAEKEDANNNENFKMLDLEVLPNQLQAILDGKKIELSLSDIKILHLLNSRKNQIVSRNDLLDHCWGEHIMPESRTLDWHISQLRKKIEADPKYPKIIQTVHGVGYQFKDTA